MVEKSAFLSLVEEKEKDTGRPAILILWDQAGRPRARPRSSARPWRPSPITRS